MFTQNNNAAKNLRIFSGVVSVIKHKRAIIFKIYRKRSSSAFALQIFPLPKYCLYLTWLQNRFRLPGFCIYFVFAFTVVDINFSGKNYCPVAFDIEIRKAYGTSNL